MQVEIGINEADTIVFVVDAKDGLTTSDLLIRDMLKKQNKRVVVAINKVDSGLSKENIYEFYSLGFDDYVDISAEHGSGVNDLLKLVTLVTSKIITDIRRINMHIPNELQLSTIVMIAGAGLFAQVGVPI